MVGNGFEWDGQSFAFQKEFDQWTLDVKRSDIATQDMKQLRVLDLHHPVFLPQEMGMDEDYVRFHYQISQAGLTPEEIATWSYSEKLRLSLNALSLSECLHLPVTFFLHPENLFVTKDGHFQIAYRGVPGLMAPASVDEDDFLRQIKCYMIYLFEGHDYMDLYNGGLEVVQLPSFLDSVRKTENLAGLEELVFQTYQSKKEEEAATTMRVLKAQFKWFKLGTIWLGALSALLLVPLMYLLFVQYPFKETLLSADEAFIKVDYTGVIKELDKIDQDKLPYTQKYELAYSYIQGLDFSEEQRTIILNNVTLKSEETYLDYWISIGRGQVDDALDDAKRLDDTDLILYALLEKREQVREDKALSGSEREQILSEVESEYKKYRDERNSLLEEKEETSETVTTSTEKEAANDKKE